MIIRSDFVSNSSSSSFIVSHKCEVPYETFIRDFLSFCDIIDDWNDEKLQICKIQMNKPIKNVFNEFYDFCHTGKITNDTVDQSIKNVKDDIFDRYKKMLKLKDSDVDKFLTEYSKEFEVCDSLLKDDKIQDAVDTLQYWIDLGTHYVDLLKKVKKLNNCNNYCYHINVDRNGGCPTHQNFYRLNFNFDFEGYKKHKYQFNIVDYETL